jgi:hypothetical protein
MTLSKVYGFWKYVSKLHRQETRRYLEMFYILKFRELVCTSVLIIVLLVFVKWVVVMMTLQKCILPTDVEFYVSGIHECL